MYDICKYLQKIGLYHNTLLKFTFFPKWLFYKLAIFKNKAQVGSGSEVGRREVGKIFTLRL